MNDGGLLEVSEVARMLNQENSFSLCSLVRFDNVRLILLVAFTAVCVGLKALLVLRKEPGSRVERDIVWKELPEADLSTLTLLE